MKHLLVLSGLLLGQGLAHGDHSKHEHKHDHQHIQRVIFADSKTNALQVLDPEKGVIARFDTVGKISGLYAGISGSYVYALHRDFNRVSVLHSGLSTVEHGDHNDAQVTAPYILATVNTGEKPTHFYKGTEELAVFNDASGIISVWNEELIGKTNDMKFIKTAQPDHGSPAVIGDVVLAGMLRLNRVDAYTKDGQFIKTAGECEKAHGQVLAGDTIYFGCTDGVLGVTVKNNMISSKKWANPMGTPENTRVGTLIAHEEMPFVYGNFGKGLVRIGTKDNSMLAVALPTSPLKFAFSEDGKSVIALTSDGQIHRIDAASGRVMKSAQVTVAMDPTDKAAPRPSLAVGEEIYLTSPSTGEIIIVDAEDLKVEKKIMVGGMPTAIALTEIEGVVH